MLFRSIADVVQLICNGAKEPVLPSGQMEAVYDKLYPYTQVSKVVKKEHIENIEKKLESDKEEAVIETAPEEKGPEAQIETQMDRCPKCGGTLVLRTASRGTNAGKQFYGCSNYPKCRYMHSAEQNNVQV